MVIVPVRQLVLDETIASFTVDFYYYGQKRNYRVLVTVCVFCTITQKVIDLGTCNLSTLLYLGQVRYWTLSDQGQGHYRTFSPFTAKQTIRSDNSTLVQASKLILSMCVHLMKYTKFMNIVSLNDFTNS